MPSPLSMPVVMALAITSEGVGPGSSGCTHRWWGKGRDEVWKLGTCTCIHHDHTSCLGQDLKSV